MTDYRVNVKIRNARLLRAIEKSGHNPGQIFASAVGISYQQLLGYVNLTRAPVDENEELRPCAEKLMIFFNCMTSDLWSEEQMIPLEKNSAEIEMFADDVKNLLESREYPCPSAILEQREEIYNLDKLLEILTPRESLVLKLRNGIQGDPMTLSEVGKELNVCAQRVRHIEAQALRKIRKKVAFYKKDGETFEDFHHRIKNDY